MVKANTDALLLRALGTLPHEQKVRFIDIAKATLFRNSEALRRAPWSPSEQHYETLGDLYDKCRALVLAMERLSHCGIPESYLREAWATAATLRETGEPFPERLHVTLSTLCLAAQIWLPDPKPKHRPKMAYRGEGRRYESCFVAMFLAYDFRHVTGKMPALGTGSPFVKFCNIALPQYGFDVPSRDTIKSILKERLG